MQDELLMRAAQADGHAYPWVMPNGLGERPWNPLIAGEHRKPMLLCANCHRRFHTDEASGHASDSTH